MQKTRKGFTLVELVVVIAVIAILAGVLIGTFASVINKANESAKVQELKQQELEAKAEDILKKIEDSNWYGWADFENSIVAKMAEVYKTSSSSELTAEKIEAALGNALTDYAEKNAKNYSTLTEEQVKAIVENALGTLKYEGVTEDQVRAIVKAAASDLSTAQVTAAQVKQIVNAANANNLTSTEVSAIVANVIANAELATDDAVKAKIDAAVTAINNTIANVNPLTEAEVDAIITRLVPVTKTATTADEFTTLATTLNSGSTIVIDGITDGLELNLGDDAKTLYIKGVEYTGTLTITAPNADITILGEINTIRAKAVKASSLHIQAKVELLVANKGRVVVEPGFTVKTLVAIPSKDSKVKVVIEETAKVENLYAQYQDHKDTITDGTKDFIEIENNGKVENAAITASEALAASTTGTTTNVTITNGVLSEGTKSTDISVSSETPIVTEEGEVSTETNAFPEKETELSLKDENQNGTTTQTAVIANGNSLETVDEAALVVAGKVARIGKVGFDTLQGAINAAGTGEYGTTVVLLKDVTLSENQTVDSVSKYAVAILKTITLNGAGHTITAETDRVVGIAGISVDNMVDVTISNITLKASNHSGAQVIMTRDYVNSLTLNNVVADNTLATSGYVQAITIGGNNYDAIRNITVIDSKILNQPNKYYSMIFFAPTNLTTTNTEIVGWSPLYFKPTSKGSNVTINGGKLTSVGVEGNSNSFGLISFESVAISVQINDTNISVSTTANNSYQSIVSFSEWYGPNDRSSITITGGSVTLNGQHAIYQIDNGAENSLTITNSNINNNGEKSANYSYTSPVVTNQVAYMYQKELNGQMIDVCSGYYDLNELLLVSSSCFCEGEWLVFYSSDVGLTANATFDMSSTSMGTFGLVLGDSSFNSNGYKLTIANGVTIKTDKQIKDIFVAPEGYSLVETIVEGDSTFNYSYSITAVE